MRWFFLWALVASIFALPLAAWADDSATDNVVQEFSGGGTSTTGFFTVQDRWEVRWNAKQVVSVAVMSKDGAIVAGAAGVLRGSLFVPLGGQYYLKVTDGIVPPPAPAPPPAPPPVPPTDASTNAAMTNAPAASTNAAPVTATNAPPPVPIDLTPPPAVTWHLQIVQMPPSVSADQALTVYAPYFTMPDTAVTPSITPPTPPPPALTDDQAHTVVTIKGDNAQGAGFLMRSPDGTFVVTHLHLLAANPNVKLFASSGDAITVLGLKGSTDRDLAMFSIQDNNYTYLPAPADPATDLQAGDQLIIPDVGAASDGLVGKPGRLVGMSPERIDFDNPMGLGSAGAPVIHVKSGAALGIATTQKQVDVSERLAQAWAANPAPGSAAIIPYFGVRLAGAPNWEPYDVQRFLDETLFLRHFHENTRFLDSYLNGRRGRGQFGNFSSDSGPPDNRYYLKNIALHKDQDTYRQQANGADENQRLDATRELLFDLESFAGTDLATLQGMKALYGYDQTWAREEIAYRLALKKELDDLSTNIVRLDALARSR